MITVVKASYCSCVHEESAFPAKLLHRELQQPGLRDGPLVDVQRSLTIHTDQNNQDKSNK